MTDNQKPIGGYFELELPRRVEYHSAALALNTGRNCLEYILRVRGYKRVYLPYYSCEVLLEPFEKLDVDYKFYHVNAQLEPEAPVTLNADEAILYINYFGLKQGYVDTLAQQYGERLIVDNTQAFFARPLEGIDTFYSCRKYFGVADGAYLYCDKRLEMELEQDRSWQRMNHLLKRIDVSSEAAYGEFQEREERLKNNPIRTMSPLSRRIMQSIDYVQVATARRENFKRLNSVLQQSNGISLSLDEDAVPMVYPLYTKDIGLRSRLIANKVFVAQYWPNVQEWCDEDSIECNLTQHLLPLPIDQRYGIADLDRIIQLI